MPARKILGKLLELGTMSNINADARCRDGRTAGGGVGRAKSNFKQPSTWKQTCSTAREPGGRPGEARSRGRRSLPSWATSTTARRRCWTGSSASTWPAAKAAASRSTSAPTEIEKDGRTIAFVDTPGHEAFTEMRARGANVTDIAVLVVAADDGVMPQTEEAISHARAAGVPIVVALNKIDLPGVNLAADLTAIGGQRAAADRMGRRHRSGQDQRHYRQGHRRAAGDAADVAELHDYKANPDRPAVGTCLEAELHEGRGVVAKLLVQNGTLTVGDVIVCGSAYGRVKAMYDTLEPRRHARRGRPSTPVNVTGLDVCPGRRRPLLRARRHRPGPATSPKQRRTSAPGARWAASRRTSRWRTCSSGSDSEASADAEHHPAGRRPRLDRGHPQGTDKLEHPEVQIKILQATVGGITEADVHLADASDAIIIGFNVVPDERARALAEQRGVQIRRYDIIYQVTDDLQKRPWKACSSRRSAKSIWAGPWCSGRSRSAAWARSPAAACWPARSQRNCRVRRDPRQPRHRRLCRSNR